MIPLASKTNVVAPTVDNPYGTLKDDTGAHDATYADTQMLQDAMVFFEKLMDESGISPSNLLDSSADEFQLYQAFRKLTKPYKEYNAILNQSGSVDPTITIVGPNDIGDVIWTRASTGQYTGTLTGAFVLNKTILYINNTATEEADTNVRIKRNSVNEVSVVTTAGGGGSPSDDKLQDTNLTIRVYD